ncbi:hypothetical protein F5Y15DRAFT_334478 [Xylariaceae sp. FL0016]|nr:hypothetical protein F5Y15DRAFT_334478 [Xylariaceae sp. FL0016]
MPELPPDPYKILGVPKDAQLPAIRSAHRKLVLKCHPDKVQDAKLKEDKQVEFQRVQQAYEILSNDVERNKYDDAVKLNELKEQLGSMRMNASSARRDPSVTRTPDRKAQYYNVREVSPKRSTYPTSSPYARSPPKSWDSSSFPRHTEESRGPTRKTASYEKVYEKEKLSRHEEEQIRRDEDRRWKREVEKEKERERERQKREEKEAKRAKEKKRAEKEREKEREREREKAEDRKRAEKERERRRKAAAEEKSRVRKEPYVEVSSVEEDSYATAPKSDKKKSSSSRKHGEAELKSERTKKNQAQIDFAAQYLARSGSGIPSLTRSQTYHGSTPSRIMPENPPAPTPPPATASAYKPPPVAEYREITVEEDRSRRSSGRSSGRRMSASKDKSSHRKPSVSREPQPIDVDASPSTRMPPPFQKAYSNPAHLGSDRTPHLSRAQTEYTRPAPAPIARAETYHGERGRDRARTRHTKPSYSSDESEDEVDVRHHSRRSHSPESYPEASRYTVNNAGRTVPVRHVHHPDETSRVYKVNKHHLPTTGARVDPDHLYTEGYFEDDSTQRFSNIKFAQQYDTNEINYSNVPHTSSYSRHVYA